MALCTLRASSHQNPDSLIHLILEQFLKFLSHRLFYCCFITMRWVRKVASFSQLGASACGVGWGGTDKGAFLKISGAEGPRGWVSFRKCVWHTLTYTSGWWHMQCANGTGKGALWSGVLLSLITFDFPGALFLLYAGIHMPMGTNADASLRSEDL